MFFLHEQQIALVCVMRVCVCVYVCACVCVRVCACVYERGQVAVCERDAATIQQSLPITQLTAKHTVRIVLDKAVQVSCLYTQIVSQQRGRTESDQVCKVDRQS